MKSLYEQVDPPNPALRRESAELYFKENVPPLIFSQAFEVIKTQLRFFPLGGFVFSQIPNILEKFLLYSTLKGDRYQYRTNSYR
jgi:hypothetical protein